MSSNINITVYNSKVAQDAAERAELAAKKTENATDNLIDPTPPGTQANPAFIPNGPPDRKGKFEPEPGFYQGFPEVTADKRWYFYWNMISWSLKYLGPIPDNAPKEWVAQIYTTGKQVYKDGQAWEANANTLSTDIPGSSAKWVAKTESGVKAWTAKVYKAGNRVKHRDAEFIANVDTLAADEPGVSYKWTENLKGIRGVELLSMPNTNIDATTGIFTTQAGYNNWITTPKMSAALGDTFSHKQIITGGSLNDIQGIYGWDASGNFVGRPANINESDVLYTHKDANIVTIAFQCWKNKDARVAKLDRSLSEEVLSKKYNLSGDFFTLVRENTFAGTIAGEVIDNSRLPLVLELKSKLDTSATAANSARIEKTFASVEKKPLFTWVTARLKSISGGVTSLPFGSRNVKIGETFKLNVKAQSANTKLAIELATAVMGTEYTYQVEILNVGCAVDNGYLPDRSHKKTHMEVAGLPHSTRSDLSLQTLSVANAFLFGGRISVLGDSILYGDGGWSSVAVLAEDLGMSLSNLAVAGTNINQILAPANLALVPLDSNIIFFSGGTNGWFVNGAVDSRALDNTYGYINNALDYFYTNIPHAQVIMITPSLTRDSAEKNLAIKNTAKAMREISIDRGSMICDWYRELGVNPINAHKYLSDTVHPNQKQYGYQAAVLKKSIIMPLFNERAFTATPYLEPHI